MISFYTYSPEQTGPLKDQAYIVPPKQDDHEQIPEQPAKVTDNETARGLAAYIGKPARALVDDFGQPDRKEPSAYGYHWWVYNENPNHYMQAGVRNGTVVTLYTVSDDLNVSPYKIGQPVEDIYRSTVLETEIVIKMGKGTYRFELSEEDLNIRPLVEVGDIYAQLSIDKFSGTLFSVRFFDKETLIAQRPYELIYKGKLIQAKEPDEEQWTAIEKGSERQIFDLTNIIRKRSGLDPLQWDEHVSEVAYKHSRDMNEYDYFAHESPKHGDLSRRLAKGNVEFSAAGENIAAEYMDGPAAFEGWLNSENHRKTMLNEDFNRIGVGVYKKNYTQNFVREK